MKKLIIRITLLILFVQCIFNINAYCLNGKGMITHEYRDFITKDELLICWHRGKKPPNCFSADPEITQNKAYILANNSNIDDWVANQDD